MFASAVARVRCTGSGLPVIIASSVKQTIVGNSSCSFQLTVNRTTNCIHNHPQWRHLHLLNKPNVQNKASQLSSKRMTSTTSTNSTTTSSTPTPPPAGATPPPPPPPPPKESKGWWHSAELWGGAGALAGWGMSGSAIYDAFQQGPEVISLTMTPVLIIYSSLFARWSMVIQPKNMFLAACHVTNVIAQSNQLRRALEYKLNNGQEQEVHDMVQKAGIGGAILTGAVLIGPMVRTLLSNAQTFGTMIASIAAADAGPFTVHFWAPMSKWMISGASFFDLNRPTEKISLAQYTALTLTGFFFTRYSLLVTPINYVLCSVNVALFGSSAWHLGRKINADYLHIGMDSTTK